jgi:hypothetical protein
VVAALSASGAPQSCGAHNSKLFGQQPDRPPWVWASTDPQRKRFQ